MDDAFLQNPKISFLRIFLGHYLQNVIFLKITIFLNFLLLRHPNYMEVSEKSHELF